MVSLHPVLELIHQGEGLQLDFKFEISDARKIARSLVAFANTSGGRLLVGVKDNGRIAGVRSEEEYYMVDAAAKMFCKPEVPFEVNEWVITGRKVLEVIIHESKLKPHKAPDTDGSYRAYIRSADQNILADPVLMQIWKFQADDSGIKLEYKEAEHALMELLRIKTGTTLTAFTSHARIPRHIASAILAKFVVLGIIGMNTFESGNVFYLLDPDKVEGGRG